MKAQNYDDFGRVIHGAKKFYSFGLNQPQDELAQTVRKNDLWPEPPIGQKDLFVEFLISKFRNCVRASLKTENSFLADEYISQVLAIKSLMESAQTEEEVISIIRRLDYERDENGNPLFNKKLLLTKKVKFWEFTRSQMEAEGFGLSEEEKEFRKAKSIIQSHIINDSFSYSKGSLQFTEGPNAYTYPLNPELKKDKLIIGKLVLIRDGIVIALNQSLEEYENFLQSYINETKTKRTQSRKRVRIQTPELKQIRHEGTNYRSGHDILPESLRDRFAFYGGQFGNWLSQNERRDVINLAYDAFSDLAAILKIEDTDISFDKKLGIAFGARGSGKGSAHYEPKYRVINLTKLKGAGSLCHEWGHALDHMMGVFYGYKNSLLSNESDIPIKSLKKIVNEFNDLKNNYKLDSLSLDMYEGRRKAYWAQTSEMFARAFNVYIIDKLYKEGIINDYLCYEFDISIDLGNGHYASANPLGKDREKLNELFDELISELKEIGILHEKKKVTKINSENPVYHFVSQNPPTQLYFC